MSPASSNPESTDRAGRGLRCRLVLVTALGEADGSRAAAAAVACEAAEVEGSALLIDLGGPAPRPTLIAARAAIELEERMTAGLGARPAAARGQFCQLSLPADRQGIKTAARAAELAGKGPVVIHLPHVLLGSAIEVVRKNLVPSAVLLRADLATDRSAVSRCVRALMAMGFDVVVLKKRLDWVAERRALFGGAQPEHGLPARLTRRLLHPPAAAEPGDAAAAKRPIVTVRGGVAEPVQGDVLVVDFDTTTMIDVEAIDLDLAIMRENRELSVQAGGPLWLLEEIEETIAALSELHRSCGQSRGGSR